VASPRDPRRDRLLLGAALPALFALSALREPGPLAAAALAALLLFARGAPRSLARTARAVLPASAGLSLASALFLRLREGTWPDPTPFVALVLRAGVIGFVTFSVLARVDLLRALAPFPAASRLLSVTLAQVHALRLVATDSADALRSRLPRRPGALDVLRNAGGIAATLFALSARNAREIGEAMRSRGF
jgi:cobalt/nickel transport system permease protein